MSVLLFIRLNILAIFTGHELQTRAIKVETRVYTYLSPLGSCHILIMLNVN
jgi:hypothetical protein